jgi:predicted DNA-binding protein
MSRKAEFKEVVSFRLSPDEKQELDKLIQPLQTNKSEFLRMRLKEFLVFKHLTI